MSIIVKKSTKYLQKNSQVLVQSFLGFTTSPGDTRDIDNYWKLIGKKGLVLMNEKEGGMSRHVRGERVLVKFSDDVKAMGLNFHNDVENSLWMFVVDLMPCEDQI
ncbi:hypothetical protein [Curvibacter gracilis]|uniref:hypothetical protein n=1 Tax=Curvibacter gracilis TaxID=230310 RepID=UPI0012FB8B9F|nr:hypothetical protein [Curvibacter gracilis]